MPRRLDVIADNLATHHPDWFARDGNTLHNHLTGEDWNLAAPPRDPLELAGLLVQEDLCIVQNDDNAPVLTAAVLCFPSRWRLAEKIGRPLAAGARSGAAVRRTPGAAGRSLHAPREAGPHRRAAELVGAGRRGPVPAGRKMARGAQSRR